uniref:Uncharacterized protein n=1 Tax=Branchiostoma floridae TaxID=7739 RepID=C3Y7D8_BRAFL|eukprot:XP_002607756.1 hypothetical protein BRAFLDRAFT_82795 [Branchiostoma floridae]
MADNGAGAKPIQFDIVHPPTMIWNPSYNGYLIEKVGRNGRPTGQLGLTKPLRPENKCKVLVNVYTYRTSVPTVGTYVVMEFTVSGKFLFARRTRKQPDKLFLREGGFDPENPEDITTTADPRVFLMKPFGGPTGDVMFDWHGSPSRVITVFQIPQRSAELMAEGDGPGGVEAQLFRLVPPKLRCSDDGDSLEVVP